MNQTELRALVARMQEQVTKVSSAPTDLTRAWDSLVTHLAIPPQADLRDCPKCGREIMRAATLCGHCWTKSGSNDHA
jgi:hypothetical protein